MLRVEIVFPLLDRDHNDVDFTACFDIIREIGYKCGGFRLSRVFGFWLSGSGEPFSEGTMLLVTDTSFDNASWFKEKIGQWQEALNQEAMYLSIHLVEWL